MSDKPVIEADEIRRLAVTHLFGRKATEVSCVDLRGRSGLCDWFVLGSCRSEVQLQSILSGVRRELSRCGVPTLRTEAAPGSRWGVLDFGVVIVHVFLPDAREFYSLERLWQDAPQEVMRPEDYPMPEGATDAPDEDLPQADPSQERWS